MLPRELPVLQLLLGVVEVLHLVLNDGDLDNEEVPDDIGRGGLQTDLMFLNRVELSDTTSLLFNQEAEYILAQGQHVAAILVLFISKNDYGIGMLVDVGFDNNDATGKSH